MNKAAEYLKSLEWSMGNGQCPECCGVPASWHGHPCHMEASTIGHKSGCLLAAALLAMGENPLMQGDFVSNIEFEHFIGDEGFSGTRPKTKDGCPRYRAHIEKINAKLAKAIDEVDK